MIRRPVLPAAAALLCLLAAVAAPPAAAQVTPSPAEPTVAAPDYATEVLGDAWDYGQPADAPLDGAATSGLQSASVHDGRLAFTTAQGHVSLLWGGYPGGLYLGREGSAPQNRIDAGRYTRISMQLFSSQETPAAFTWSGCEGLEPRCEGGMPLTLRAGWHTYDLPLVNRVFGFPQDWTGEIHSLRLLVNPGTAASYELDWARVYAPSPAAAFPNQTPLTWDVDDDPADDTADRSGWGRLPCPQGLCNPTLLPPGSYHLRPAGSDEAGRPVVLRRPARPVLLDPDVVGGPEYAAANPWDFDRQDDVWQLGNAQQLSIGDRLSAVNARPVVNDPYVFLHVHSGLIDPQRYHRMTVHSSYEGPFGLEDAPGGGAHGRVLWYHADQPAEAIETKEWVTYSGASVQTYDLADPEIHEQDIPIERQRLWTAAPVQSLRWDPNEDPAERRWTLDRVALRADDEAGSSFRIRWYDDGYAPGSTISLFRDDDADGFDGEPIALSLDQRPGVNTYTWDVRDVPEGRWWVHALVEGPAGVGQSYSTGPVQVDHRVQGQGASPATPVARDLLSACPQGRVPEDGLADVPAGTVQEAAVDCAFWWGVARGTSPGRFAPGLPVNRGQMALFVARLLQRSGAALPASPPDAFADDAVAPAGQQLAIDQLAAVGVVGGVAPGRFAPEALVSRDQMATFLVRAYELRTGTRVQEGADHFRDDAASVHAGRIDAAATLGIATGVADEKYGPFRSVSRLQMGSFLARLLDVLVAAGAASPPVR